MPYFSCEFYYHAEVPTGIISRLGFLSLVMRYPHMACRLQNRPVSYRWTASSRGLYAEVTEGIALTLACIRDFWSNTVGNISLSLWEGRCDTSSMTGSQCELVYLHGWNQRRYTRSGDVSTRSLVLKVYVARRSASAEKSQAGEMLHTEVRGQRLGTIPFESASLETRGMFGRVLGTMRVRC